MAAATERILRGPLGWEVARFGTPLALGMALQTTFNVVDAYILSQLPREEVGAALGALGLCDQVAALGTIVSYGLTIAVTTRIALQHGAGNDEGVRHTAWQSVLMIGALSALFAVAGLLFAGPIMRDLIGAKGDVAAYGTSYLRVIVGGSFTIFFLLLLTSLQRALGSAKTPAALLVGGNVLNILLALLLVFGPGPAPRALAFCTETARFLHVPRMGMLGAAWATIVARLVVLAPNAWVLVRRFGVGTPPPRRAGPDWAEWARIWRVAWPSSAQFFVRIGAGLFVNSLVARFFTTQTDQTANTAMGLVFRLDTMAIFVAMGWGSAAQTFVGHALGAGRERRARRSGLVAAGYDAITNVLLVIAILWTGHTLLRIFDRDPEPVRIGVLYLGTVAPSYLGLGLGIVLASAMSGAGATRTTLVVDLAVILGFQVPVSLAAVTLGGAGLLGLFRCVAITSWVSGVVYLLVYVRARWTAAVGPRVVPAPAVHSGP